MPGPLAAFMSAALPIAGNVIGGLIGADKQLSTQKSLANTQYQNDLRLMQYQNAYNSPANQMARYKEAGLNPNLIYGQGTPGNMESAPRSPNVQSPDYQSIMSGLGTQIAQMKLMQSQTDLTNQKVSESGVKQDLMKAQTNLTKSNPYMRKEYVDSMVLNLESIAKVKQSEAGFFTSKTMDQNTGARWDRGWLKMQRELDLLGQKFNLGSEDQKIKAKIVQSKEFQNALQKIQVDWMRNADITPQHIYQGIMLLLSKMM